MSDWIDHIPNGTKISDLLTEADINRFDSSVDDLKAAKDAVAALKKAGVDTSQLDDMISKQEDMVKRINTQLGRTGT